MDYKAVELLNGDSWIIAEDIDKHTIVTGIVTAYDEDLGITVVNIYYNREHKIVIPLHAVAFLRRF